MASFAVATMTAVAIGMQLARAAGPQDVSHPAPPSGRWTGDAVAVQSGACKFDNARRSKRDVILVLDIDADGNIRAHEEPPHAASAAPDRKPALPPWEGKVEASGRVVLDAQRIAVCAGEQRTYPVRYQGSFKRRGNRWELKLKGTHTTCPSLGCEFINFYQVRSPGRS